MTISKLLNKPYLGDWLKFAKEIPDNYVHLCITSPPYWRARKYEVTNSVFGGDPDCDHEWGEMEKGSTYGRTDEKTLGYNAGEIGTEAGRFCKVCKAWNGQLGNEPSPWLYIKHMADCFDEVYRVLRDDGVFFLNIGDNHITKDFPPFMKKGELAGIPHLLVNELRSRGWYWEADNIWYKPNPMPDSAITRFAMSHEYVFQFYKKPGMKYWVHEEKSIGTRKKPEPDYYLRDRADDSMYEFYENYNKDLYSKLNWWRGYKHFFDWFLVKAKSGRRHHDVWVIPTRGFDGEHIAPFPTTFVKLMLDSGSSEHGCCNNCMAPYQRIVAEGVGKVKPINGRVVTNTNRGVRKQSSNDDYYNEKKVNRHPIMPKERITRSMGQRKTLGWSATCVCDAGIKPCVVLDPFGGSFTTGRVAKDLGRDWLSCDLSLKYMEVADKRLHKDIVEGQVRGTRGVKWT